VLKKKMETEGSQNNQKILKRNKVGGLTLPNFKS
jgi:hypothetical protein